MFTINNQNDYTINFINKEILNSKQNFKSYCDSEALRPHTSSP